MRGDAGFPIRVAFTKRGKVRFVSHRDVARAFERAFRIEALPLAFTQGFSPRPKVSFGLALSVGHESDAEYLDLELTTPMPLGPLAAALTAALPEGIDVVDVVALADRAPALQEAVGAVEWEIEVRGDEAGTVDARPAAIADRVTAVLAAPTFPLTRVRKGKTTTDDIRPAIRRLNVLGESEHGTVLAAELATRPTSLRPAELIHTLGPDLQEGRVRRIRQWIERDGERYDPLAVDTRTAVEARAS
ncbi:MAG: TIGR03936 family radical SAM-associated protein [Acidimicrobiia bacterium]